MTTTSSSTNIPMFYAAKPLSYGAKIYKLWNYESAPHMLIVGATGTGKSYATMVTLGHIAKCAPAPAQLIMCNFKGDTEFDFLEGAKQYYRFRECSAGLDYAHKMLEARQQFKEHPRNFVVMVFDEWASFLNSLDKKEAEAARMKMSNLLMMARSFNIHVLVAQQRADAEYFATARLNFGSIIHLGTMSTAACTMHFADYKEQIEQDCKRGEGYYLCGTDFDRIVVPTISDMGALQRLIRAMTN